MRTSIWDCRRLPASEYGPVVPAIGQAVGKTANPLATERMSSDPQQAERVAKEILKRVEARTGLKMDLTVLPIMNPDMAGETQ